MAGRIRIWVVSRSCVYKGQRSPLTVDRHATTYILEYRTFVRFGASSPSRVVFTSASGPFPFHDLRSDPRSRPRSHQPFRSPFATAIPIPPLASAFPTSVSVLVPVPILVPVPRGSASRRFSLHSRGALLYKRKQRLITDSHSARPR